MPRWGRPRSPRAGPPRTRWPRSHRTAEGYLYDEPHAKAAFHRAAEIAHGAGRKVALSLLDTFCVMRHHADFLQLVDHHVDVLFGNELEMAALLGTTTIEE